MTFLSPAFFWAFLSLIPLAAIYFLKVRPRKKETTAYFLWEKVFTEKRSSSLFNRLRDVWSLLLMLLAFAAVALALTRPELASDERKDLLILIDNSASMRAGQGTSRLDAAIAEATDIVRALNGNQRAALGAVSREVTFVTHLTESPRELMEALEKVAPTDLPLSPDALAGLYAGADKDWAKNYRVLFITDGSSSEQSSPEGVELVKVGEPAENIGIAAADLQILPGTEPTLGLYVQLASSFMEKQSLDLVLKRKDTGATARIIPMTAEPGLNPPEVVRAEGFLGGEYVIAIEVDDALALDNEVSLVAHQPRPISVAVSAADRYFMETSVLAFSRGGGLLQLTEAGDDARLTLARANSPESDLALIFQPSGDSPWWSDLGDEIEAVAPKVEVRDHPILRHVDASALPFLGAKKLTAAEGSLVLVASDEDVPLIYLARAGGRSAVVINMDPMEAEFYFSAWFPVIVHGAASYLAGREDELLAAYPTGSTAAVPGVQEGELTSATDPSGAVSELKGKRYGPLDAPGFYELKNKAGTWPLAASLLSPAESMLDNASVTDSSLPISKGWAPSFLLTALAILVLVVESILYHRRKVG